MFKVWRQLRPLIVHNSVSCVPNLVIRPITILYSRSYNFIGFCPGDIPHFTRQIIIVFIVFSISSFSYCVLIGLPSRWTCLHITSQVITKKLQRVILLESHTTALVVQSELTEAFSCYIYSSLIWFQSSRLARIYTSHFSSRFSRLYPTPAPDTRRRVKN